MYHLSATGCKPVSVHGVEDGLLTPGTGVNILKKSILHMQDIFFTQLLSFLFKCFNSLRPSDAYMRR